MEKNMIKELLMKYYGDKYDDEVQKDKEELANKIFVSLDKKIDVKLNIKHGYGITVMPCDEYFGQYSMGIYSFSEDSMEPTVRNLEDSTDYEYIDKPSDLEPEDQFADLFFKVLDGVDDNIDDNIKVIPKTYKYEENRVIKQPLDKLKKLLEKRESLKDNKYYETDENGTIKRVNPYRILRALEVRNSAFENNLRSLIKVIIDERSLDKKKEFLMIDDRSIKDNRSIKDDNNDDYINYNRLLINECIKFDANNIKSINDAKGWEKEILKFVKSILIKLGADDKSLTIEIDGCGIIHYKGNNIKEGYIGQVFLPDDPRILFIKTRFYVDETNYWFVPEYRAILYKRDGDNRSFEERTKLISYIATIKRAIHLQLLKIQNPEIVLSPNAPTNINYIYKHLYKERFNYDFLAKDEDLDEINNALPLEIRKDIVKTLSKKVKYSDYYQEEYGINRLVSKKTKNNGYFNADENILVIEKGSKGIFDPEATSSGKMQGSTRYLVKSAEVNPDGTIKPGKEGDRTPIFNNVFLRKYSKYNPFDRNQMVFSNLMRAYSITEPVETALMTCGGWNMEDGFVVSKDFADNHQVPGKDGKLRSLKIGDKMLDRGGNKGVISVIIDPDDVDPEDKELLNKLRQVFRDNPNLAVIASPYSGLSRYNGATAREMMKSKSDLNDDGKVYENCIGKVQYIITTQFADKKTRIYDEEDYKNGDSRKASPQLSWALCAKDAPNMLKYFYSTPKCAKKDVEYFYDVLRVVSYFDIPKNDDGSFEVGWANKIERINLKDIDAEIIENILMNPKHEGKWYWLGDDPQDPYKFLIYILPVCSRLGYEDYAGRYIESDITKRYRRMLESSDYDKAEKRYEAIKYELKKQLYGKDNIIKKKVMTRAVANSSTAIWTPDPRLSIESIAISKEISNQLNVNKNDYLLIWRDPILRDANVRYMKVERVDPNLTGIAINPVMAKGFDGDFDGDTVAVVKIDAQEYKDVHKEAIEKFSVENNLYDEGKTGKPLIINTGLDLVSAEADIKNKNDVKSIDEELQRVFEKDYCLKNAMIKLTNDNTVIKSLQTIYDSGAKKGDIKNYEKYFKNTKNDLDDKERIEVQKATAIKAYVGVAGRYSQQLMRAFRNVCPKAVLELTYPNTQALLQAKHDPEKAVKVYKILQYRLNRAFNDDLRRYLSEEEKEELKNISVDLEKKLPNWNDLSDEKKKQKIKEEKRKKLWEWSNNLDERWDKLSDDDKEKRKEDRKNRIKKIYNKENLNKPIGDDGGDDGIDKKHLNKVCGALGEVSLRLKVGSKLDELAYATDSFDYKEISKKGLFKGKYTQYFNYSDDKSKEKESGCIDNDNHR